MASFAFSTFEGVAIIVSPAVIFGHEYTAHALVSHVADLAKRLRKRLGKRFPERIKKRLRTISRIAKCLQKRFNERLRKRLHKCFSERG